ncbi:MAG: hypothetical protein HY556_00485 [Euryarchaeota archaeon]|nr:hypothetical protein [Euryarchaeota archaeon]
MLDVRRRDHFSYDMRQVLVGSTLPVEQQASFLATLFARGSLGSSDDAKEYAQQKFEEKLYGNKTRDDIFRLIDHYSKWR